MCASGMPLIPFSSNYTVKPSNVSIYSRRAKQTKVNLYYEPCQQTLQHQQTKKRKLRGQAITATIINVNIT